MTIIEAVILGLVQGLTEFIPVSSSGHLLLAHELFGSAKNSLSFDVLLHVGTLLALIVYFRKDIWKLGTNIAAHNKDGRLARLLILATVPAVLVGFLLGDFIDERMRSAQVVATMLALVGVVMLLVDRKAKKADIKSSESDEEGEVTTQQGVLIGVAQSLALIPGVSRSGATITAGIFLGLDRVKAARFSFLMAIPIVAGSALGILLKDSSSLDFGQPELYVGMVAAFISGLFAIKFLLGVIGRVGLMPFAYYRIAVAVAVWLFLV